MKKITLFFSVIIFSLNILGQDIYTFNAYWHTSIILNGLSSSSTYYIMIDGNASQTGTFGICVEDISAPGPVQTSEDCFTAEYLCDSASISVPNNSATSGTLLESPFCFSAPDSGAHWYQFTPLTSGNLCFSISPTGIADYNFAVYDVTTGCPGFALDCDYTPSVGIVTGLGCASPACHPCLPIAAGSTYAILVSRLTPNTVGFTLDFAGSTALFGGVPVPVFTSNQPTCTGLPVNFINQITTTNQSLMFSWNFGDNGTSTLTNPSHSYSTQGTYLATLIASCGVSSNIFQDSVLINCDSILTSVQEINELNFSVYPNPTNEDIVLRFNTEGLFKVELLNTLGEKVFSQPETSNQQYITITVADFPPGIYFITVTDQAGNKVTRKVVKL